jgi:hypothetical protein
VTQKQLDQALVLKEAGGGRLGEVIVEAGYASTHEIAAAVAEQYGLEFVSLAGLDATREAVDRLPEHLARRYEALPVRVELDGTLVLAFADPTNLHVADDVLIVLGEPFRIAVADPAEFDEALGRAYRRGVQLVELEPLVADDDVVDDIREVASSRPTINLVNSILSSAMELGASDVHVEPRREDLLVRTRVDGVMRELAVIPKHMKAAVVSRLKIMGGLDIAERRLPQDGRRRRAPVPRRRLLARGGRARIRRPPPLARRERGAGPLHERLRELDLVCRLRQRRRRVEVALQQPRDRCDAGERDSLRRRGDADERERPPLPVHRLQVDRPRRGGNVDLEDQLARLERGRRAVVLGRQAVEVGDGELACRRAERRVQREQRGGHVRRMRRGAEVVGEDRVLAVLAFARMAAVAAVQPARELEPPVPAPCRLEEVAAERSHIPQLRARGEPARFAQCSGDLRRRLELRERRPRADGYRLVIVIT